MCEDILECLAASTDIIVTTEKDVNAIRECGQRIMVCYCVACGHDAVRGLILLWQAGDQHHHGTILSSKLFSLDRYSCVTYLHLIFEL